MSLVAAWNEGLESGASDVACVELMESGCNAAEGGRFITTSSRRLFWAKRSQGVPQLNWQ